MRSWWGRILFAGLILCGRNTLGLAAEDPEVLIRQGIELRRAGLDARAEGYFRRAYELAATPRAAAQLGLVELAISDFIHAEEHLTEALGGYHDAWILQYLGVLKDSREVARRNLFHLQIVGAPRDAVLKIEGMVPRPLSPDGIVWLDAGRSVTIRIESPCCRPTIFRTSGAAGEGERIPLEMQPLMHAPAEDSEATSPPPVVARGGAAGASVGALRIAGVATSVAGVAAGIIGVVFYEQGTSKLHEYQAAIRSKGTIPWNPKDEDWEGTRNKGVALLVAGGVGVVGGVSLYLLGNRERDEREKISLTAIPGNVFLSYRRSF